MSIIEESMFREYDVRGRVAPGELNEHSVKAIAKGFGTMLRKRSISTVVVGSDSRSCSEDFRKYVTEGLLSTGCDVIDIGLSLSPIVYFAQYHLQARGAVMITGSHNPPEWTGFKFATDFSSTLLSEEIRELFKIVKNGHFASGKGELTRAEVKKAYCEDLLSRILIKRPLRIVVDAGNGTAGAFAPDILRAAGCHVTEIFCDLDVTFPHHFPNPSDIVSLRWLRDKVLETQADIGFAYDGDGDRLGVIDNRGRVLYADRVLLLLARQVLERNPGGKVVFDVKCSQVLVDDIIAHGGIPIMWKTGHSYIKAKMREEKADLAGERSGHIFFPPHWDSPDPILDRAYFYGFDDAVFASLRLAQFLANQGQSIYDLISEVDTYLTSPEIHVYYPDDKKYELVNRMVAEFKEEYSHVIDINGARVSFPNGWGLIRASSNLPQLVLVFEARSKEEMDHIKDVFRKKLVAHGCTAPWEGDTRD